jgi:cytochrome c peroxidase
LPVEKAIFKFSIMKKQARLPSVLFVVPATVFLFFLIVNCGRNSSERDSYEARLLREAVVFFRPMPANAFNEGQEASTELIHLGKMLYYEPRLSRSGLISCHTCHNLSLAGVDNLPVSVGHSWQKGRRNAPTVLNAALHSVQFHDGREPDVESQALMPIVDPVEMASSEDHVMAFLNSIPAYRELFSKAFPGEHEPVTFKNTGMAIGAFERTLVTSSPFDRFIKGDLKALGTDELAGLESFMHTGCIACHTGETLGGQTFARFITPSELTLEAGPDEGRFEVTGLEEDKHFFKVPSLLNVALTYPYFHDGSEWSLAAATREVARAQLGKELTGGEIDRLVSFMYSLSGEVHAYARELPVLPPSTPETPVPEFD